MFEGKKIFVLGMAKSGYAAAKLLAKNNRVLLTDCKEQDSALVRELEILGVNVIICQDPENLLTDSYDYIIKNPGVPKDNKALIKAEELGIPAFNESELSFRMLPENVKLIGITGTNGKTTTTTLIYEFLIKAGLRAHLTGNIGYPFASFIEQIEPGDIVVNEVSIHQLYGLDKFKTDITVLVNLYEAHLDLTNTYEEYISTKRKAFAHHTKTDLAVLNLENDDVLTITKDVPSRKLYFSNSREADCYIKDDSIYYQGEKIIDLSQIRIKGMHNYENCMAAILVAKQFDVSNKAIKAVLTEFNGVEHRLEFVAKIKGREFINDSKATNIKSTQIALGAYPKSTILILGGFNRDQNFEELKDYIKNVKSIVCYGETKERIEQFALNNNLSCTVVDNLIEATNAAYNLSEEGDTILLSPAAASWDQYPNFEIRGTEFKKAVAEIEAKIM